MRLSRRDEAVRVVIHPMIPPPAPVYLHTAADQLTKTPRSTDKTRPAPTDTPLGAAGGELELRGLQRRPRLVLVQLGLLQRLLRLDALAVLCAERQALLRRD
eukprot:COSAG01_NODE_2851_length_6937_cov_13.682228_5_plen_102_part_00